DLDAEMVDTRRPRVMGRDRKVHARILEHPFGIVRLLHRRLRGEQGGVEADRLVEVRDRHLNVQAIHRTAPFGLRLTSRSDSSTDTAPPKAAVPPQQSSVRKPISAFMPS